MTISKKLCLFSLGISAILVTTNVSAQSSTAARLVPVISLLLSDDPDPCFSVIEIGDVVFDTLKSECPSQERLGRFAQYFTFTHQGGPIHIDLISDFPNSYDPYIYLRVGEGLDGVIVSNGEDNDGHDDAISSRLRYPTNLDAGTYTIEATASSPNLQGSFNLSLYGDRVTAKATGRLNDTGIASAGISDIENGDCSNAMGNFAQQDCALGKDADSLIGRGISFNDGDGADGFSFLKVSSTGAPLTNAAISWSCVKDNVTGLMWEIKTNSPTPDLHDKDDTFTWYNTNNSENGGTNQGTANGGNTCKDFDNTNTLTYCNTEAYVNRVNSAEGLCGYNDWRMPTVFELQGLVNYELENSMIDRDFFRTDTNQFFWSASPHGNIPDGTWRVDFSNGKVQIQGRMLNAAVRLVRGGQ